MVSWQKLAKILCLSNAPNAKLHVNHKAKSGQNKKTVLFKGIPINFTTKGIDPDKHTRRCFEMSEIFHHTGLSSGTIRIRGIQLLICLAWGGILFGSRPARHLILARESKVENLEALPGPGSSPGEQTKYALSNSMYIKILHFRKVDQV